MLFTEIPQITIARYYICVSLRDLNDTLDRYTRNYSLILCPDFQRARVWTDEQRSRYVEWFLRGGMTGRDILFNCAGWQHDYEGPMVLVDGYHRITALRMFLRDELPAFGQMCSDFGPLHVRNALNFYVNDLATRREVLEWYLAVNDTGAPHSHSELGRVRALLAAEDVLPEPNPEYWDVEGE